MRTARGIAVVVVMAFCAAFVGASTANAADTWGAPIAIQAQSSGFERKLPDAALSDGSTIVSWLTYSGNDSSLVAKKVNRDGTSAGPPITIAAVSATGDQDSWINRAQVVPSINGQAIFVWVENTYDWSGSEPVESFAVRSTTLEANGSLNSAGQLDYASMERSEGSDSVADLQVSSSNNGHVAATWGINRSRGEGCSDYYSDEDCVYSVVIRGATKTPESSSFGPAVELANDVTPYDFGYVSVDVAVDRSGNATAIWTNGRLLSSGFGLELSLRRFSGNGVGGAAKVLSWIDQEVTPVIESGADDTASVAFGTRVFRVAANGDVSGPFTLADSGNLDRPITDIYVNEKGTTTATWNSLRNLGAGQVNYSVWTRQLAADGSMGGLNPIVDRTVGESTLDSYFYFSSDLAIGDGVDSGVLGVNSVQYTFDENAEDETWSGSFDAFPLAQNATITGGGRLGAPNSLRGTVAASADATLSASWIDVDQNSDVETIKIAKLVRPQTCPYVSSTCRAELGNMTLTPRKKTLRAGQKLKMRLKVTNIGDRPASDVKLFVSSNQSKKIHTKSVRVPSIAAGETVTRDFTWKIKPKTKKGKVTLLGGTNFDGRIKSKAVITIKPKKGKKASKNKRG